MKFSYERYVVTPSAAARTGVLYRPEVPLRVVGPAGEVLLLALLDTGADATLLPEIVARVLHVAIDDEQTVQVSGIGGEPFAVNYGTVEFELHSGEENTRWKARVGFMSLDDSADDVAVLGHAGFFEHFRATFDGKRREVELTALAG